MVASVRPCIPGTSRSRRRPPRGVSRSECASGNCTIRATFANSAHGQGTRPKLSLRPKNMPMTMASTAAANARWQARPKMSASAMREAPGGGFSAAPTRRRTPVIRGSSLHSPGRSSRRFMLAFRSSSTCYLRLSLRVEISEAESHLVTGPRGSPTCALDRLECGPGRIADWEAKISARVRRRPWCTTLDPRLP